MSVDKIRGHQTLQVSWRRGGIKNFQNFQGFNNFKALENQSTFTLKVNPGHLFRSKVPRVSNCPRLTLGAWQGCMYLGCCSHLRGPAPAITPLNGPQCVIKRLAQWLCKYGLLAHRKGFLPIFPPFVHYNLFQNTNQVSSQWISERQPVERLTSNRNCPF